MVRKYLAIDLEIATELPDEGDWDALRPLGISCIGTQLETEKPRTWHSWEKNRPALRMTAADLQRVLTYARQRIAEGYTLLTWNGLKFDLDILSEESCQPAAWAALALNHTDLMFHVFCELGYPLALDAAAKGMGLVGKPAGLTGAMAPKLWQAGQFDTVLAYVAHDVATTMSVARACEELGRIRWTSQRGRTMHLPLPNGWLTVREALRLPVPDTSWMSRPMARADFMRWIKEPVPT